ncbi:MAG: sigma-70 family RNA polymerase sigma factor [Clostridiales bacterium]
MDLEDFELINICLKNNNEQAFEELVRRYKKLVYSVVYNVLYNKKEVFDVSQEVFIKVYKNLDKYNPEYKFSTWIVKISTNLCLDINRKKKIDVQSIEEIEFSIGDFNTPEDQFIKREQKLQLDKMIESLPEKYRTLIILFHKNNLSYDEITKIINKPMSIVKNRIYRARIMLRDKLYEMRKEDAL